MGGQLAESSTIGAPFAIREMLADCKRIGNTLSDDINKIASLLQEMILKYYAEVRLQAQQSFRAALAVASVGILFFVYAVWRGMSSEGGQQANIGVIAGSLIQVISGINFYLYARAARQFSSFHVCLERTNRFLLANTLCEKLSEPARDEIRADLARLVATAPMLTLDAMTGKSRRSSRPRWWPSKPQPTGRAGSPAQP